VTKIINLFGGPGVGKSSIAAGLTYKLKKKHISCNNPYEFPKTVAWDNNLSAIKDQLFIFANQHRGIAQAYGKVDYIIVDSPILFSIMYNTWYTKGYPAERYNESFNNMVVDLFNSYDNINVLLKRNNNSHNSEERFQNLDESLKLDKHIKNTLDEYNVDYNTIKTNKKTVNKILDIIWEQK